MHVDVHGVWVMLWVAAITVQNTCYTEHDIWSVLPVCRNCGVLGLYGIWYVCIYIYIYISTLLEP